MSTADLRVGLPPSARTSRTSSMKFVLQWTGLALLTFPIAGYVGWGIAGHVDGVVPALVGGGLTGLGVGFAQWLMLRREFDVGGAWIPATGIALAIGLAAGAAVVDYETTALSLAIMGAISGAAVGIAQGALLRKTFSLWLAWAAAMPLLWAIAWLVSNAIGVDVSNQFTVFGASGSIAFGVLSGLLLAAAKRRSGSRPVR